MSKKIPLQQSQKRKRAKQYVGTLDDHGTAYDPDIHAINADGLPKKRKDGHWQVKGGGGRKPGDPKVPGSGIAKGGSRVATQRINTALEDLITQSDTSLEKFLRTIYTRYPDLFSKFLLKKMDHELAESSEGAGKTIVRTTMIVLDRDLEELQAEIDRLESLGVTENRDVEIVDAEYEELKLYDKDNVNQELQEAIEGQKEGNTYDNET
ncbi:hypothetical protein PSH49_20225 [Pseudoalteromonas sp. GABNS16G]|uniref:hypothetical protein n=2 Tax=unclassified Pseudoalteromonas TaxID=194690 RepID=UPI002359983E|nr:hypothetical protein [Pseudoalteromonas sp. GABNS16G]MDC9602920.1 hypothetical protein [Pseudoalteromonas sp. GABNS16G]